MSDNKFKDLTERYPEEQAFLAKHGYKDNLQFDRSLVMQLLNVFAQKKQLEVWEKVNYKMDEQLSNGKKSLKPIGTKVVIVDDKEKWKDEANKEMTITGYTSWSGSGGIDGKGYELNGIGIYLDQDFK